VHLELFVPNNDTSDESPAINVYDPTEGYPGYSDVPKRTIVGAATLLNRPAGLLVDSVHQELYVANDLNTNAAVLVFPLSANGNAAPIRILEGPQTTLVGPLGLALDVVHDELIVVSYKAADGGSITVFPRTASGDVAPIRTVQGPLTGFNRPQDVALDLARDEIVVANSYFDSPVSLGSLLVFPRQASGNVAPIRQITGPSTDLCNPIGLVLDAVHDELVVTNSAASGAPCGRSVATFAASASGDVAPLRKVGPGPLCTLNNSESVLVTTSVQCSDPSVAEGTPCDDGNACTTGAKCTGGICAGGSPRNCDDGNPCSVDTCNPYVGCVHAIDLTDSDHDGVCDLNDCAPGDPTAFALPAAATGLSFASNKITLSWASLIPASGSGTLHQLVRGILGHFPGPAADPTETCLATSATTPTATDGSVPPVHTGYWYLVRGKNACGRGPYGFASGNVEELSAVCP
jgi:DNA-binding beta-propeller fold protein YncE